MKKKEIADIIHTYFLKLKKHFREIKKNITAETIKPFRIEIKKLRAFLRLLAIEIKHPDDLKIHEHLKEMHKSGGRFRDLQLHQQRIREAMRKKSQTQYSNKLLHVAKKEIEKEKDRFLSNGKFGTIEKKLIKHLPGHYNTSTIKKFFQDKLDAINAIIVAANWTDKEMHDIRKQLKDILYIIKLYEADLKKSLGFRFWNKTKLQQVKKLEDELGFLNDTRNALALLDNDRIRKHDGEEKKLLQSLRRQLLNKKRKQKEEVIAATKRVFSTTTGQLNHINR